MTCVPKVLFPVEGDALSPEALAEWLLSLSGVLFTAITSSIVDGFSMTLEVMLSFGWVPLTMTDPSLGLQYQEYQTRSRAPHCIPLPMSIANYETQQDNSQERRQK